MAAEGMVGYNLDHVQIAPKSGSPTYTDLKYAMTMDASISQDSSKLSADASKPVTAYSAPEGAGNLTSGQWDADIMAIFTGGTASATGTGGTKIDRLEIKGNTNPPAIIVVGYLPNVDGQTTLAGTRIILPNAKASVPSGTMDQETWATLSSDLVFDPDANNNLIIYEFLATAPTFTSGVIAANLTPPA